MKQGLWTRIRNQYDSASAALSQLSLSSTEHDGDKESDTVIHNALVKYYQSKSVRLPAWLGVEQNAPGGYNATQPYDNSQSSLSRTTSSSLQDIYKRREQQQQQQSQQPPPQQQQGPGMNGYRQPGSLQMTRSPSYNQELNNGPVSGPTAERSDRFRNKLKTTRANW